MALIALGCLAFGFLLGWYCGSRLKEQEMAQSLIVFLVEEENECDPRSN